MLFMVKYLIESRIELLFTDLIIELMSSSNHFSNTQFVKFISSCFDLQNNLISM